MQRKACKKLESSISNIAIDTIKDDLLIEKGIRLSVLRLDKIHPVVSGNKIFKLHYFLKEAITSSHKTILTFGGAYSNHLVATAFACKEAGLKSIGIVRGEEPAEPSATLIDCRHLGMQLKFISRQDYYKKEEESFIRELQNEFGTFTLVPEGGYHPLGAKGAALITERFDMAAYSHVCTATGTATTLAGLLLGCNQKQKIITINVLKGASDIEERLLYLTGKKNYHNLNSLPDYHFGGYAKKTNELIGLMNLLWQQYKLPTDFVYTAKLFYAVFDKIKQGYFPAGSNILCLHTGGLQGNKSLPVNSLLF